MFCLQDQLASQNDRCQVFGYHGRPAYVEQHSNRRKPCLSLRPEEKQTLNSVIVNKLNAFGLQDFTASTWLVPDTYTCIYHQCNEFIMQHCHSFIVFEPYRHELVAEKCKINVRDLLCISFNLIQSLYNLIVSYLVCFT